MIDLTPLDWVTLVVAALFVGFAKTAISGVGSISVALFAVVLPARESTGALLPLLIVGDLVAVAIYRRHADWPTLVRLMPSVVVGVLVGVVFVALADDTAMRRTIGAVLLVLVAVHLWQRRRGDPASRGEVEVAAGPGPAAAPPGAAPPHTQPAPQPDTTPVPRGVAPRRRRTAAVFGLLAGFTTMVANAAGPVMSLYLLSARATMLGFLGTAAWFFLLVNVFKVPFSLGLGLITPSSLALNAVLVPALLVGAVVGRIIVKRLDQARFELLVLAFTVVASLNLIR